MAGCSACGLSVDAAQCAVEVYAGEDGVGKGLDRGLVGAVRVVAVEGRAHEGAVDRAPLRGQELGQLLAPLFERRRPGAGPDEGVECEARHAIRMVLSEQRRAQSDPHGKQHRIRINRRCHSLARCVATLPVEQRLG